MRRGELIAVHVLAARRLGRESYHDARPVSGSPRGVAAVLVRHRRHDLRLGRGEIRREPRLDMTASRAAFLSRFGISLG